MSSVNRSCNSNSFKVIIENNVFVCPNTARLDGKNENFGSFAILAADANVIEGISTSSD